MSRRSSSAAPSRARCCARSMAWTARLSAEHLVIADAMRPVALAGVMGGLESEISDSTRNVLIESAWFDPGSIRRTSRFFGMHTEASHRFERGADPEGDRLGGRPHCRPAEPGQPGTVLRGCLDAHPKPHAPRTVAAAAPRDRAAAGPGDSRRGRRAHPAGAGVRPRRPPKRGWEVRVPSYRLDVSREVDVIEEIARIYGYDKFTPTTAVDGRRRSKTRRASEEERRLRTAARSLGYDETIGYSFISRPRPKSSAPGRRCRCATRCRSCGT